MAGRDEGAGTRPVIAPPDPDFEALFRSTYARLVVALSLASDRAAAEDAVQDAFVQALRHWDRVRTYEAPAAWVRHTAINRLANQRRGLLRRDRAVDRLGAATGLLVDGGDVAAAADLRSALADLPLRERTAVVLHHIAGVSVAELARDLDLPEGSVKSILSRTRGRLRGALAEVQTDARPEAGDVEPEGADRCR